MIKFALVLTCLVATSSSAMAQNDGRKFICKELADFEKQTLILTQVKDRPLVEGVKERFALEVYSGYGITPRIAKKGYVVTEDVGFTFKSDDHLVSAFIFLDELDQASLTEGNKTTNFDCN